MTSRQKQSATTNITIKRALPTVTMVESFGILVISAINVHISPPRDLKSFKVIDVGINGYLIYDLLLVIPRNLRHLLHQPCFVHVTGTSGA